MNNEAVCQKLGEAAQSLNAGQLHVAEESLADILAAYPNQANALHMLGHVVLHRGEVGRAIGILERAVMARSGDPDIRVSLANALGADGRYQDAVSVCRTGLRNAPDSVPLLVQLGRALGLIGADEDAVEALQKANDFAAPDPMTLSMLGTLYFRLGDLTRSAWAYEAALKLDPDDIETRYHLLSLRIRTFDCDAAIDGLQRILKLDGDHVPALRSLGNILGRTDRYAEAIKPLQRAMALNPKDNLSVNELIYALAIAGDPNEAVKLGEAYLRDNPEATFIHRQLAFAYLRAGEPMQALSCCDQALHVDRPPTTALSLKAAALNELDEREAAAHILGLKTLVQAEKVSTPEGYESLGHFNEDLQARILNHPSLDYMPSNRSMKKGRGTVELFDGAETGAVAVFKQMIVERVDAYVQSLPDDAVHPFIPHMPDKLDVKAWGNVYDDDGMQTVHFHPPAWLSGVYYPLVPDRIKASAPDDYAGALELGRAYFRLESSDNPPVHVIKPEDGLMVLFPAYVGHQTIPLGKSSTPRVSIAFDLVPPS